MRVLSKGGTPRDRRATKREGRRIVSPLLHILDFVYCGVSSRIPCSSFSWHPMQ